MAWYKVGTVNVTTNSSTVTGTGTAWVQAAAVGESFLGPDERLYEITAINSSTSLTVSPAYKGPTSSGQHYSIVPTQGYLRDLAARAAALVDSYAHVKDGAGAGKFAAGTAAAPSLRGAADEDTGVNLPGGNVLDLVAGGAVKAKATSAGVEVLGEMKAAAANITGNQTTAGTNTHSGLQRVTNATASTSSTTGAQTIVGGLGVGGAVHSGEAQNPATLPNTQLTTAKTARDIAAAKIGFNYIANPEFWGEYSSTWTASGYLTSGLSLEKNNGVAKFSGVITAVGGYGIFNSINLTPDNLTRQDYLGARNILAKVKSNAPLVASVRVTALVANTSASIVFYFYSRINPGDAPNTARSSSPVSLEVGLSTLATAATTVPDGYEYVVIQVRISPNSGAVFPVNFAVDIKEPKVEYGYVPTPFSNDWAYSWPHLLPPTSQRLEYVPAKLFFDEIQSLKSRLSTGGL